VLPCKRRLPQRRGLPHSSRTSAQSSLVVTWLWDLIAGRFVGPIPPEPVLTLRVSPADPGYNNKLLYSDFVGESVDDMLNNGYIFESKSIPHGVSPLSVSVYSLGKKRLILDQILGIVNKQICTLIKNFILSLICLKAFIIYGRGRPPKLLL